MNIQDRFPLGLTGWISLQCRRFSRVFSNATVQKHQFFSAQPPLWSKSHILYMTIGKTIALTIQIFVGIVMSLLFNTLSRFVIVFLPRSNPVCKIIIKYKKEKWFYKIIRFQYIFRPSCSPLLAFLGEGRCS